MMKPLMIKMKNLVSGVLVKNPVIIRKSLRRKKNLKNLISGAEIKRKTLKNQKMPMKKQKRKNPVSGAEIKIMILLKKMMKMKNQAECFHLLLPKPFQKNTLKIFCGNLKWVFWKGMWLWK